MDADRAIAIIETLLAPKSLNPVQIQIVRGVIAGDTYQKIATATRADAFQERHNSPNEDEERSESAAVSPGSKRVAGGYQIGYIRETGAQLWQSLTQRLGQKVTKNSLAAVLLWYTQQSDVPLAGGDRSDLQMATQIGQDPATATLERPDRFYGRAEEIATLTHWCLSDRCRLIFAIGMGGMGKTTLAWEIVRQLEGYFQRKVWRSLVNLPPVSELCVDLLQCLSLEPLLDLPESLEGQIELLIARLRSQRCLIVLDNVESILADRVQGGQYLVGYEGYDRLLKALCELPHQSCAILTSREKPHTIARAQIVNPKLVRSMTIDGIALAAGHQLIQAFGCPPLPDRMWKEVHAHYGGNPLALKIAAITAVELTGGGEKVLELYPLMQQGQFKFRNIDDILERQFDRLSDLEQQLVYWLAIEREPVTGAQLRSNLVLNDRALGDAINALQSLSRRCIIACHDRSWSIQPVTMAYVTSRSIDLFVSELAAELSLDSPDDLRQRFRHLNTYAIVLAQAKDYLRQTQVRYILRPIIDRLLAIWQDRDRLSRHFERIVTAWQTLSPIPAGYLAGNMLNLAIELAPDRSLKDFNCAGLPIRSAYLADATLHHVNFTAAAFDRSVFAQAFGGIIYVLCHPAGELIATSDANGDVSLWQMADGQRVAIYQGHTNWTRALAIHPDGTILASSSEDRTVRFWDVATGKQLAILGPCDRTFRGIKFSRDGRKFVVSGDDCQTRIYDLPGLLSDPARLTIESHCLQSLVGHTNWVFSATYSPDESQMATASADGTVRIWNLSSGECTHILPHEHWAIRTLFSPDGRKLIVSGMSATIYIWDTRAGQLIQTLNGHRDWIWSIELSADGNTLFSTGEDRTIRVWDLSTGSCQQVLRSHKQRVWTISLTPDGRQLISGSEDRTIKIWDLQQGKCIKTINGYGNWIKKIVVVPQQDWLISCHRDRTIQIWNVRNFARVHTLSAHTDAVLTIALSPDERYLASSSLDRTIKIWDLHELNCIRTIATQAEGICALAFSPDSSQVISGSYQGDLQLWDLDSDDNCKRLEHPSRIEAVVVCAIRQTIATACENKIRIWDLNTGECLHTIIAHYLPTLALAFSPDGRYLASGGMDKAAKVWDTTTWECLQTLTGQQSWTTTVVFSPIPISALASPPNYQLLVGGGDRSIKRWEIDTGKCLATYTGHTNWVWSIAYSPDGTRIYSASEDETIEIWDVDRSVSLHTLQLKRPYEDTNISGATGLQPGQRQTLKLLGAIDN